MMGYGVGAGTGWIFMIVFWAALVAVIVWAVTRLVPSNGTSNQIGGQQSLTSRETPLDILDRRLASGEIDPDEYAKIRAALSAGQSKDR